MKQREVLVAIRVCVFLFGIALLDGVCVPEERLPAFVPEMHATEKAAIHHYHDDPKPDPVVLRMNTTIRPFTAGMQFTYEQPHSFIKQPLHSLVTTLTGFGSGLLNPVIGANL